MLSLVVRLAARLVSPLVVRLAMRFVTLLVVVAVVAPRTRLRGLRLLLLRLLRPSMLPGLAGRLLLLGGHRWLPSRIALWPVPWRNPLHGPLLRHDPEFHDNSPALRLADAPRLTLHDRTPVGVV